MADAVIRTLARAEPMIGALEVERRVAERIAVTQQGAPRAARDWRLSCGSSSWSALERVDDRLDIVVSEQGRC